VTATEKTFLKGKMFNVFLSELTKMKFIAAYKQIFKSDYTCAFSYMEL